ncbi:hypothetical protein [Leptolyngbya sp. FACHB-16]|nr:hypothetical protein [Leptolyngbya sp. FACHB-16]
MEIMLVAAGLIGVDRDVEDGLVMFYLKEENAITEKYEIEERLAT